MSLDKDLLENNTLVLLLYVSQFFHKKIKTRTMKISRVMPQGIRWLNTDIDFSSVALFLHKKVTLHESHCTFLIINILYF